MFNKYNNKTYQLATAFMVSLGVVLEERKDELLGRSLVPVGGEQVGVQIGDKYVTGGYAVEGDLFAHGIAGSTGDVGYDGDVVARQGVE